MQRRDNNNYHNNYNNHNNKRRDNIPSYPPPPPPPPNSYAAPGSSAKRKRSPSPSFHREERGGGAGEYYYPEHGGYEKNARARRSPPPQSYPGTHYPQDYRKDNRGPPPPRRDSSGGATGEKVNYSGKTVHDVLGTIAACCRTQEGSRFIQRSIEEGSDETRQLIFEELETSFVSLMTDNFGNYVLQKMVDTANMEQISKVVPRMKDHILELSENGKSNYVVQKIIQFVCKRVGDNSVPVEIEEKYRYFLHDVADAIQGKLKEMCCHQIGTRVVQCLIGSLPESWRHRLLKDLVLIFDELVTNYYGSYVLNDALKHGTEDFTESVANKVQLRVVEYSQDQYASMFVKSFLDNVKFRSNISWELVNTCFRQTGSRKDGGYVESNLVRLLGHGLGLSVLKKMVEVAVEEQMKIVEQYVDRNREEIVRTTFGSEFMGLLHGGLGGRKGGAGGGYAPPPPPPPAAMGHHEGRGRSRDRSSGVGGVGGVGGDWHRGREESRYDARPSPPPPQAPTRRSRSRSRSASPSQNHHRGGAAAGAGGDNRDYFYGGYDNKGQRHRGPSPPPPSYPASHYSPDKKLKPAIKEKRLIDGIPHLQQHLTRSSGSVPSEIEHKPCVPIFKNDFFIYEVNESVAQSANILWTQIAPNKSHLSYATEADIVGFVRIYLQSIITATQMEFEFATDLGIKHVAPDICVITYGGRLVGVVEVKKPTKNILLQPTVLGELLDQMLLVEGFYSSGPVIGILTTLEEWIIAWFPGDHDQVTTPDHRTSYTSNFITPKKEIGSRKNSPPGETPSQRTNWSHGVLHDGENDHGDDAGDEAIIVTAEPERKLHITGVLNAYHDYDSVLEHIYSAFIRMGKVDLNHQLGVPRCLFILHKGDSGITWHPIDEIPLDVNRLASSKYPQSSTKRLLVFEDLGRGSTGKAWLCCTISKQPAVCVLKFSNRLDAVATLDEEKSNWHRIYPEFRKKVRVEKWSGSHALVMPHFCTIQEEQRRQFYDSVKTMLEEKFQKRRLVHNDVRWRNLGFYNREGSWVPVLYDLHNITNYDEGKDAEWIIKSMETLFPIA